ncbi:sucrase ferredoxin [Nocardioides mesophilus]|uniref:Sucrase ferredoxin n=1 Tax=Nocardioides mesophilus TaxID=433659 RepID=A0A7G9R9Y3_9ACTN|nr:sucrase ferredoxin [Nocardioides mesophilus]QNN52408.1 sucrase ferredoxin [Nocardioides mesophilus]
MSGAFRCSVASEGDEEPIAGTASTVRAFLLVEAPGPWGVDAVTGSRLPPEVRSWLHDLPRAHRVRPLMIRGHGRQRRPGTRVFAAWCGDGAGGRPWLESAVLEDPRDLLDLPVHGLAAGSSTGLTTYDGPLLCVCTHGKHDACCAERGRPLCRALHEVAPEHTWEVSHIGGDRFAPNVLVLPEGLYYGRLAPEDAGELVESTLSGELDLAHLRGRSTLPFAVQAAEIYLRAQLGDRGSAAPELLAQERRGERTRVRLRLPGGTFDVEVETRPAPPRQLTCRATALSAPPAHRLLGIEAAVTPTTPGPGPGT